MTKLKLSAVPDNKPVKLSVELPADIHRDLIDYARVLGTQTGEMLEPARLIAPMLARFMASDRGFAKARKELGSAEPPKRPGQRDTAKPGD